MYLPNNVIDADIVLKEAVSQSLVYLSLKVCYPLPEHKLPYETILLFMSHMFSDVFVFKVGLVLFVIVCPI